MQVSRFSVALLVVSASKGGASKIEGSVWCKRLAKTRSSEGVSRPGSIYRQEGSYRRRYRAISLSNGCCRVGGCSVVELFLFALTGAQGVGARVPTISDRVRASGVGEGHKEGLWPMTDGQGT